MADDKKGFVEVNPSKPLDVINTGLTTDMTNKKGEDVVKAIFGMTPTTASDVKNIATVFSSPYGMFRSVPILCRMDDCAYKDVCMVPSTSRTKGQRCPMEVATILSRFMQWCEHFNISIVDNMIQPKDMVDATLIKDLVTIEVQQMRGENKIAINGDFMTQTLLDIDRKCTAYYGAVVAPEAEYLLNLQQKKEKILNQLNATRKDKAQDKRGDTPSEEAMKLFKKIKEMESDGAKHNGVSITDIEFDEDGNIVESPTPVDSGDENVDNSQKEEDNIQKEEFTAVPNINLGAPSLDPSWNNIDISDEE